ncbi:chemotaxis protein CheB, partial [Thermodesulfobacteriota bacterium]
MPIRVLIIDDSAFNRRTISEILSATDNIEVVGIAVDGEDGLKKLLTLKPDVVTCDLEMPVMDGFAFIRMCMANNPTPIVVVSSKKEDVNVFKALDLGAVDFVAKPTATVSARLYNIQNELIEKVNAASQTKLSSVKSIMERVSDYEEARPEHKKLDHAAAYSIFDFKKENTIELLAIGASTGGPAALKQLLHVLPINLNVAVVIAQHMPPGFTSSFAQRLNSSSSYIICEAKDGETLEKGKVLLAPGGKHLTFIRSDDSVYVKLVDGKPSDNNVPSVNMM